MEFGKKEAVLSGMLLKEIVFPSGNVEAQNSFLDQQVADTTSVIKQVTEKKERRIVNEELGSALTFVAGKLYFIEDVPKFPVPSGKQIHLSMHKDNEAFISQLDANVYLTYSKDSLYKIHIIGFVKNKNRTGNKVKIVFQQEVKKVGNETKVYWVCLNGPREVKKFIGSEKELAQRLYPEKFGHKSPHLDQGGEELTAERVGFIRFSYRHGGAIDEKAKGKKSEKKAGSQPGGDKKSEKIKNKKRN